MTEVSVVLTSTARGGHEAFKKRFDCLASQEGYGPVRLLARGLYGVQASDEVTRRDQMSHRVRDLLHAQRRHDRVD